MQALKRSLADRARLENLGIEVRLQLAFVCVLLLVFIGSAISFWHFQRVRDRVTKVSAAEGRLAAVLRINNSLLTLMSRVHRAADTQEPEYFETEARKLLTVFRSDTAGATSTLQDIVPTTGREKLIVDSLSDIVRALPERLSALTDLARAGDWVALHARLANQVDHTDDVAEALMREAAADVSEAQNRLFEDINQAQHKAAQALAITGILSFLTAALLGLVVTRSITRPLAILDAGARALARGDFEHQVAMRGSNELTNLAAVFNRTTHELAGLYGQLRQSEARFRSLIEKASDLILLLSRTGELLYVSPSSVRVLGYSPGLLVGRSIRELIASEEGSAADQMFSDNKLLSNDTQRFELRFRRRDGSLRLLDGVVTNLLGDAAVAGVLINARDVSEHRKAELALKHSEERLQELLIAEKQARSTAELLNQIGRVLSAELDEGRLTQSLIDIATQLVKAELGIFFYNTGRTEEQWVALCAGPYRENAERLAALRHTVLWPASGNVVRSDDISGHEAYVAAVGIADGQQRPAIRSYLAAPVLSRSKHVFGVLLFVHSDIGVFSEQDVEVVKGICAQAAIALENARLFEQVNVSNRALEDSNEALRRANDDLSVFAYSASHDLQEPLRNLSLYSQMLQRTYRDRLDPRANEFIGHLTEGAARMSDLVKDLLSYLEVSSTPAHSARLVSVEAAISKALLTLQTALGSNEATVVYDDLPAVAVDAVHLQQLFQNLISNAIKYRSAEVPQIRISAEEANGYWCFSVKDNGIGISPQYRNTVFRLFKRLHGRSEYPGTGVGLAICQKIVERHGGRIWVESEPGKGSDFRFTLPRGNGQRL
jgi:PAS domain S-box-containing protein